MENLTDYSQFIFAAYAVAGFTLAFPLAYIVSKYLTAKSKIKNEK